MILEPKYTIERYEHGWLVRGPIPADDLTWLIRLVPDDGIADALVSQSLGGSLALTTQDGSKAWRKQLGIQA